MPKSHQQMFVFVVGQDSGKITGAIEFENGCHAAPKVAHETIPSSDQAA
jgi:hypothetical protein